jgi:hypothetical protein
MRNLIIIATTIIMLSSFNKKTIPSKEILHALDNFNDLDDRKLDFKLFADSTYIFNYNSSEWAFEKKEMYRGRYFISSDTIKFFPFKFKYINSDKALIKDGFIEFLDGERPLRIKIKNTILNRKPLLETFKSKDYVFFSYNPNHYNCFSEKVMAINLDNIDLAKLDSILTTCIIKNTNRKPNEYHKQCISVIDSNGNKLVWINLTCSNKYFQYVIYDVNDGGDCYASLKVNLTEQTYFDLWVNGYE